MLGADDLQEHGLHFAFIAVRAAVKLHFAAHASLVGFRVSKRDGGPSSLRVKFYLMRLFVNVSNIVNGLYPNVNGNSRVKTLVPDVRFRSFNFNTIDYGLYMLGYDVRLKRNVVAFLQRGNAAVKVNEPSVSYAGNAFIVAVGGLFAFAKAKRVFH